MATSKSNPKKPTKKPIAKKPVSKSSIGSTKFDDAKFESVLGELRFSSIGLISACKRHQVNPQAFYKWVNESEDLQNRYARAREMQAHFLADEILEIADSPEEGIKTKQSEKGLEVTTGDMVEHRKLKIDARKWVLAKLLPQKYGDRVHVEQSGETVISFK